MAVEIVTQNYSLVAADLRQPEQLERALAKAHFDARSVFVPIRIRVAEQVSFRRDVGRLT